MCVNQRCGKGKLEKVWRTIVRFEISVQNVESVTSIDGDDYLRQYAPDLSLGIKLVSSLAMLYEIVEVSVWTDLEEPKDIASVIMRRTPDSPRVRLTSMNV
jgi:hypothetical protein